MSKDPLEINIVLSDRDRDTFLKAMEDEAEPNLVVRLAWEKYQSSRMWTEYGETYGQLCHDLEQIGESIVGVQVDIKKPEAGRLLFRGGRFLIGDIDQAGDLSGEEYVTVTSLIVTHYRRLLTAEQLQE